MAYTVRVESPTLNQGLWFESCVQHNFLGKGIRLKFPATVDPCDAVVGNFNNDLSVIRGQRARNNSRVRNDLGY